MDQEFLKNSFYRDLKAIRTRKETRNMITKIQKFIEKLNLKKILQSKHEYSNRYVGNLC